MTKGGEAAAAAPARTKALCQMTVKKTEDKIRQSVTLAHILRTDFRRAQMTLKEFRKEIHCTKT